MRQSEIEAMVLKTLTLMDRSTFRGSFTTVAEVKAQQDETFQLAVASVREDLERANVPVQRKRRAIVDGPCACTHMVEDVQNYLPSNYTARQRFKFEPTPDGALAFLRALLEHTGGTRFQTSSSVDFPEESGLPGFILEDWMDSGAALAQAAEDAKADITDSAIRTLQGGEIL